MQYIVEWDNREEGEILEDVERTVGSAEFLVPLNGSGTEEPLPLTALTVEQLIMVAESDPPGEMKAIRGSPEDKEEYARLVDEATKKSNENTPNSTKELVEWMFLKEVCPASKEGNLVKRKQQQGWRKTNTR